MMRIKSMITKNSATTLTQLVLKKTLVAASVGAMVAVGPLAADDTEVFFGQVEASAATQPNVMFVLDTSGSMNSKDGGSQSRMQRMKDAVVTILNNSANVNVGIMRFNGSSGGGAVLYPVTPIDSQVCEANNCGNLHLIDRISDETDDAIEQLNTGNVDTDTFGLRLGTDNSGNPTEVGLRFTSLDIPAGVNLTNAKVEFTSAGDYSDGSTFSISAELVPSAETYEEVNGNISSRPDTSGVVADVSWSPTVWGNNGVYETPDLTSILQPLVDQTDWCGGNSLAITIKGTGTRNAVAHKDTPSQAPALKISYDSASVPTGAGCTMNTVVSQVNSGSNDAEQRLSDNRVNTNSSDLEFPIDGGEQLVGMRFQNINIPQGTTIASATIQLEVDEVRTGTASVKIYGHATNDSWQFRNRRKNISSRAPTAAEVIWDMGNYGYNEKVTTPDIKSIIQEIVNRGGWNPGNDISIMVKKNAGTGRRTFESYNGEPVAAPKLRIVYQGSSAGTATTTSYITARDKLKQVVNGMTTSGGTPIVDAYLEAANYFLARPVDYGRQRGVYGGSRWHRVSTPLSWANGAVSRSAACSDTNLDSWDCASEQLTGNPTYISPMASSCQTNHIVLLSDGQATSNSSSNKVMGLTGASDCGTGPWTERCGTELADYLVQGDFSPHTGKQNISTYTIGFNNNDPFLTSIANYGGGTYNTANSSAELVTVFDSILADVLSVDTSFVAPAATVNQFNRLTHKNEIYFALFKPSTHPTWSGNLKRYTVDTDPNDPDRVTIIDASTPAKPAIDPTSGFFASDAVSHWGSGVTDGNSVVLGGAANNLPTNRNLFTFTGNEHAIPSAGAALTLDSNSLHENNTYITDAMVGVQTITPASQRAAYKTNILKWSRGVDILDEDGDGSNVDWRAHMGDPMHSRPVVMNYATGPATADATIYVATNEGFIHAIDDANGQELWAFMPQKLLGNIRVNYDNQSSVRHPYGLDGGMSTWTDDLNDNLMVDSGEDSYVYVGMRRGGKDLYALDVSNRTNPRLAWVIQGGPGGTPGFEELGETWSRPVPTKIVFNGAERNVLIFSAGYDTNQDPGDNIDLVPRTQDTIGRGLFIVDARTGAKIWSALGSVGGNQLFPDMEYSMPGDVRVIDIDFDGYTDQLYLGDMGGQIWRFDVKQHHQSGDLLEGGVLARIGGSTLADNQRFYYEPDVSLINEDGDRFLSVAIGSGWRAHPLAEEINNEFFMIRSNHIYGPPSSVGKGYGKEVSAGVWEPITEADLVDVTTDLTPTTNDFGWRMGLPYPGEKVLGDAITINGQIIFTTYRPNTNVAACSTAIGSGGVYVVDVIDASPTIDLDEDGDVDLADREKALQHGGIPPEATALIVEADGVIKPTILVGPEQPIDPDFDNLTKRTYWVEQGN